MYVFQIFPLDLFEFHPHHQCRRPYRSFSKVLLALLLLVLTQVSCEDNTDNDNDVRITTNLGIVVGRSTLNGTSSAFLNVRYAHAQRFAAAVPVGAWWNAPLDARSWGPGCPQNCGDDPELRYSCPAATSEDCLHVNIYAPLMKNDDNNNDSHLLPVLVFLPGGNFRNEGADSILKDSSQLARDQRVIVVIVNSRLGALGFLIQQGVTPNLGIEDQREALRFVRSNIAAWGGDANQVTLFGQSSGATSLTFHMVSPESRGLFQAAISESNPLTLPLKTLEIGNRFGAQYSEYVGCSVGNVTCLKAKPLSEILAAQAKMESFDMPDVNPLYRFYPWTPLVDKQPLELILAGKAMQVPTIFGVVSNEAINYALSFPNLNAQFYQGLMQAIFGRKASKVLARYPADSEGAVYKTLGRVATEYLFTCSSWAAARALKGNMYHFKHIPAFVDAEWNKQYSQFCDKFVCHGQELVFVFNPPPLAHRGIVFTPEETHMSASMQRWWSQLVALPRQPPWPLEMIMEIDTPPRLSNSSVLSACDFWDSIGYMQ